MDKIKKGDQINQIQVVESRFQFAIILSLFLPTIWEGVSEFSNLSTQVDMQLWLGIVITMIFFSYIFVEITKDSVKEGYIEAIGILLLCFSYLLVIIIGTVLINKGGEVAGWEYLIVLAALAFAPWTLILLFALSLFGVANAGWSYLKTKFKKES